MTEFMQANREQLEWVYGRPDDGDVPKAKDDHSHSYDLYVLQLCPMNMPVSGVCRLVMTYDINNHDL